MELASWRAAFAVQRATGLSSIIAATPLAERSPVTAYLFITNPGLAPVRSTASSAASGSRAALMLCKLGLEGIVIKWKYSLSTAAAASPIGSR
jgi:hypothetical protein